MSRSRYSNLSTALSKARKLIVSTWVAFGVVLLAFAILEIVVDKVSPFRGIPGSGAKQDQTVTVGAKTSPQTSSRLSLEFRHPRMEISRSR